MRIRLALFTSTIVVLSGVFLSTNAQKATESFIPIGKSPGVSGVSTHIGRIDSVDVGKRTVTIRGNGLLQSVEITGQTKIWLDLSKYKAKNRAATLQDLKKGRRIEVKPQHDRPDRAEWIKIDPGAGG